MKSVIRPRIHLSSSLPDSLWATGWLNARYVLRCDSETLITTARAGVSDFKTWDDPLAALDWMSRQFPHSDGRWIGYLGYDLGRLFERIPSTAAKTPELPLFEFAYCTPAMDRPNDFEPIYTTSTQPLVSNFSREAYEQAVARAIEYIGAGDVFQVNLSQRFTMGLPDQPAHIYQRLVQESPAHYGALLSFGDYAIISNSPELFLRVSPRVDGSRGIITRPIKGTRPRTPPMDIELRDSLKDQAELNMIVDLERNDLGRVCEIGSVKVTRPREIEAHPTVYHGVATIEGILRSDVTFVDLLRAAFPGGSITGAPKIRAMQIIEELEPVRRGPYCGAIGYLSADGRMEFNIAIRTMIVKDGLIHIPVGGGIVADSKPAEEYEETLVKARAMFAALGINKIEIETPIKNCREEERINHG